MRRQVRGRTVAVVLAVVAAATLAISSSARARTRAHRGETAKKSDAAAVKYRAVLLMDAASGAVLSEENGHLQWPPASMTKMMLMLIASERVRDGAAKWEEPITTSRWASKMGGSQVYLKEGEVFTLAEMMQAVIIHSANDASMAVAEHIAGSGEAFVDLMNERARQLALADTTYQTPHGLPPAQGQKPDITSAHDLAVLARELMKYPEVMKWAGTKEAPFRNGAMILRNTNHLVRNTSWVDGLKTGYYREAGFCVTATATRNDMKLIAVVLGSTHKRDSFAEAAKLLNKGFSNYKVIYAVKKGDVVANDVPVQRGKPKFVRLVAGDNVALVAEKTAKRSFQLELALTGQLAAPLVAQSKVGEVIVKEDGKEVGRVPALTFEAVEKAGGLLERFF
ncbi:MAG: D-alanyl-D-alanine carboxypeptidase [Deltaproteobacteria bacterium]|nr:D-alanyl-D-alanine carboxypeptidase [Deltaproteobacteria bacterium]